MLQLLDTLGLDLYLTECTFKCLSSGPLLLTGCTSRTLVPLRPLLVSVSLELIVGNLHFKYLHANVSQERKVQRNVYVLHNKRTMRTGAQLETGEHDNPLCIPLPGCIVGVILWQFGSFHLSRLCRFLSSHFVRS